MKRNCILSIFFLLTSTVILSQPITWQRSYKSSLFNDHISYVLCKAEGTNIYFAGLTSNPQQGYVVKLNQYGDTIWGKFVPQVDWFTCGVSLPDAGCLLGSGDGYLVRIAPTGIIQNISPSGISGITSINRINDSAFVFCGVRDSGFAQRFPVIGKTDANGNVAWIKHLSSKNDIYPEYVYPDNFGNFYICGIEYDSSGTIRRGLLLQADASGTMLWKKNFSLGSFSVLKNFIVYDDCLIASGITGADWNSQRVFLLKTSLNGDSLMARSFPSLQGEHYTAFLNANPGNFYFAYSRDTSYKEITVINRFDKILQLLKSKELWPLKDYVGIHQMMYAPSSAFGEIYLTGETDITEYNLVQFYVARIDSSLNVLPPPIAVNQISTIIPKKYKLHANYPNPFNPQTKIVFDISGESDVKVTVFDVLGREITVLFQGKMKAGTYETVFDGTDFTSGLYFCEFRAGNYKETHKMILLK